MMIDDPKNNDEVREIFARYVDDIDESKKKRAKFARYCMVFTIWWCWWSTRDVREVFDESKKQRWSSRITRELLDDIRASYKWCSMMLANNSRVINDIRAICRWYLWNDRWSKRKRAKFARRSMMLCNVRWCLLICSDMFRYCANIREILDNVRWSSREVFDESKKTAMKFANNSRVAWWYSRDMSMICLTTLITYASYWWLMKLDESKRKRANFVRRADDIV